MEKGLNAEAFNILMSSVVPALGPDRVGDSVWFHILETCAACAEKAGHTQKAAELARSVIETVSSSRNKSELTAIARVKALLDRCVRDQGRPGQ